MKSDELKALLLKCHDKTDLPTPLMKAAGMRALVNTLTDDSLDLDQAVEAVWNAMLQALREDDTVGAAPRGDSPRGAAPTHEEG